MVPSGVSSFSLSFHEKLASCFLTYVNRSARAPGANPAKTTKATSQRREHAQEGMLKFPKGMMARQRDLVLGYRKPKLLGSVASGAASLGERRGVSPPCQQGVPAMNPRRADAAALAMLVPRHEVVF